MARARAAVRQFRHEDDDVAFKNLLFGREIQVAASIVPWSNIVHSIVIAMMAFEIMPTHDGFRVIWLVSGLGLNAYSFFAWRTKARQPLLFDPRSVRRHMLIVIVLFGVLWAAAAIVCFPTVPLPRSALLSGGVAGLMGGGAIALSANRTLAVTWILAISAGAIVVQALQPNHVMQLQAIHATVYALLLCTGAFYLEHSFRARCRAEYLADAARQDVELFLNEFEGGSRDWIWETRADGTLSHVSIRFCQVSGLNAPELQGLTLRDVIERLAIEITGEPVYETVFTALEEKRDFYSQVIPLTVFGERRWWLLSGRMRQDGAGWRGIGADITDVKAAQDSADRMARTDALTGLPNRHALNSELASRIGALESADAIHFSILDLDNFKAINDSLGHPLGDKLLVAIGRRITSMLENGEFCARLGGDEFVVIDDNHIADSAAMARFKQFQSEVFRQPFRIDGSVLELTCSLGLTSSRLMDAVDPEAIVAAADLALYGAKDLGRNRVHVYSAEIRRRATARANSVRAITSALANHEFEVFYQPQISVFDSEVLGFEALMRWRHPDGMLLPPDDFVELAEQTGLIVQLGREVISMVCQAAVSWPAHVTASVNVSPRQVLSNGFADALGECLAGSGLDPRRLTLEVSESALVDPDARENLAMARTGGMRVALDDFGTGYSSLAQMSQMPVDEIKIDRSFVDQLRGRTDNPTATGVIGSVIDLARALGVMTLADGVETPSQLRRLASLGCDAYQGLLESPALATEAVLPYLAERAERIALERADVALPAPPLRLINLPDETPPLR